LVALVEEPIFGERGRDMRVFRSPELHVRVAAFVVLVIVGLVVLGGLSAIVLPAGYADQQSWTACDLPSTTTALDRLARGSVRDLLVYLPLYVAFCLGVVAATSRGQRGRCWDRAAIGAIGAAAVADVLETLLFRATVLRLGNGESCSSVTSMSYFTVVMTWLKWTSVGAFVVVVGIRVLLPDHERSPVAPG
jgi:hypothetical protein